MNRIMVLKGGSPALHMLGNIGRAKDDYIRVHREENGYYVGSFEEGFGFIEVRFKKDDCRMLTAEEVNTLNKQYYAINEKPLYKIHISEYGDFISTEVPYENP